MWLESAKVTGTRAKVMACLWDPSTVFYLKSGEAYGDVKNQWSRQKVELQKTGGRWIISSFGYDGRCPGRAPE